MANPVSVLALGTAGMVRTLAANARLLVAITRVELSKKYAGSVLGPLWISITMGVIATAMGIL